MPEVLISPSVLAADPTALGAEVESVSNADMIHFDVMDGHFVAPLTFGAGTIRELARRTDLPFDVHLMIDNPEDRVGDYLVSGVRYVTVHWEALTHAHRVVSMIRGAGAKVGIALNPATPVCVLDELGASVDLILVMTVDPGFGGQQIMDTAAAKIARVRAWCDKQGSDALIEVDGGVSERNIGALAAAGADSFVAGSAVFGQKDHAAAVEALRTAAYAGQRYASPRMA